MATFEGLINYKHRLPAAMMIEAHFSTVEDGVLLHIQRVTNKFFRWCDFLKFTNEAHIIIPWSLRVDRPITNVISFVANVVYI